jgi:LacI family transcriptional regulator
LRHITQKDIANELSVTRITVSKALNNSADISLEMRKKVHQLAQEKEYIPNHMASSLHRHKTNTVGVVVPDVSNSFFSFAIDGIMDMAAKHGYHIILTISRESAEIEKENIITLLSQRVDGLLIAVSKETTDISIYETVKKMNVPLVFFDRAILSIGFSSVGIDDRKAASQLVEYAVMCGYKNIAHLAGSLVIEIGRERHAGYLETLKKYNIPIRDEWIISGGFDKFSGYEGCKKLLNQDRLPEVIFASNDRIAQGAYKAIKEAGLKIPDDIGIVSLGHREFAEILSPPLTIIDSSPDLLGQTAMGILIDEMAGSSPRGSQHIILKTVLEVNNSIISKS